jgi:hypothetical protein
MAEVVDMMPGGVERFQRPSKSTPVSDELGRISAKLCEVFPEGTCVSFSFDGQLSVHVDVRKREDVTVVEMLLPKIEAGLFHTITRGGTPHHPFYHRISARVAA